MPRHARWVVPFLCVASSGDAFAANFYVQKGATGSNSGADWTNAWSELDQVKLASVACGDTVWLAGGTYTKTLTLDKTCTSAAVLTVQRVRATDTVPAAAAGWSAAFDSTVKITVTSPGVDVPSGAYMTVSGRVPSGIVITIPSGGGNGIFGSETAGVTGLTLTNIEVAGPSCVATSNCATAAYGINFTHTGNVVHGLLVDHCNVHNVSEAFREASWESSVIQYNQIHDTNNDGVDHEDVIYTYPFNGSGNVIWRYNTIYNSPNDGVFFEFGGAQNFYFYGNVYWNSGASLLTTKGPGAYGPMFIFNNVFASSTGPCSSNCAFISPDTADGSTFTGVQIYNNVFYFVANAFSGESGVTSDYNAYSYTMLNGYPSPTEAHALTFNPATKNPFVNVATGDFRLVAMSALIDKGKTLTADGFINVDLDGNTRGIDGTWDIGAFEYVNGTLNPPAAPTNLASTVH
jgi:hypothetical protein